MDPSKSLSSMCCVVRPGVTYEGKQGPSYAPGVSAESVGAKGIWLGMVTLNPGARTRAHYHAGHESAFYVVSGEIDIWFGDELSDHGIARAGEYLYIPSGISHVAVNRSSSKPAVVIGGRTDPSEHESVVLQPELDIKIAPVS